MNRAELEHVIRAAGAIADDNQILVLGSQSILGSYPNADEFFLRSREADVCPFNHPELTDVIDGSIGEHSAFHEQFLYYAEGVSLTTAVLPDGWRDRLVEINNGNTRNVTGLCLDVHDLAISKYVARREKDIEFTRALMLHEMVDPEFLLELADKIQITETMRDKGGFGLDESVIERVKTYIEADIELAKEQGIYFSNRPSM